MSATSSLGKFSCQNLEIKNQIRALGADNDSDSISLLFSEPGNATGHLTLTVPAISANATLLTSESSIGGLPTGNTPNDILVSDGSGDFQNVAMSGDATIQANGVVAIANNKVTTAMLQNDSVSADKLANNSVSSAKLQNDSCSTDKIPNNAINASKLADNACESSKISNDAIVEAKIQNDACTDAKVASAPTGSKSAEANSFLKCDASKDIDQLNALGCAVATASTSVEAPIMYFGSNSWRMKVNGGALEMERWDGSAWTVEHSFANQA